MWVLIGLTFFITSFALAIYFIRRADAGRERNKRIIERMHAARGTKGMLSQEEWEHRNRSWS